MPLAKAGSQRWMRLAVNRRPDRLLEAWRRAGTVSPSATIDWASPLESENCCLFPLVARLQHGLLVSADLRLHDLKLRSDQQPHVPPELVGEQSSSRFAAVLLQPKQITEFDGGGVAVKRGRSSLRGCPARAIPAVAVAAASLAASQCCTASSPQPLPPDADHPGSDARTYPCWCDACACRSRADRA